MPQPFDVEVALISLAGAAVLVGGVGIAAAGFVGVVLLTVAPDAFLFPLLAVALFFLIGHVSSPSRRKPRGGRDVPTT